jgi:hypothetical protein
MLTTRSLGDTGGYPAVPLLVTSRCSTSLTLNTPNELDSAPVQSNTHTHNLFTFAYDTCYIEPAYHEGTAV